MPDDDYLVEDHVYYMGPQGGLRVRVEENDQNERYLTFYKWWPGEGDNIQYFRLNKEKHWKEIKKIVEDDFSKFLGWGGFMKRGLEEEKYVKKSEYEKEIEKREEKIQSMREELERLNKKSRDLRQELSEIRKTNISDMEDDIKELEKMICKPIEKEHEYSKFLKERPWMFGPKYLSATCEQQIGMDKKTDFLLERFDNYYDVVELKKPTDKLFTKNNNLRAKLKNAVTQIINYLHKCDLYYSEHYSDLEMDILKPKGYIVIGKANEEDVKENLRIHNAYLNNIEIITYNQLLETAKESLNTITDSQ